MASAIARVKLEVINSSSPRDQCVPTSGNPSSTPNSVIQTPHLRQRTTYSRFPGFNSWSLGYDRLVSVKVYVSGQTGHQHFQRP